MTKLINLYIIHLGLPNFFLIKSKISPVFCGWIYVSTFQPTKEDALTQQRGNCVSYASLLLLEEVHFEISQQCYNFFSLTTAKMITIY